MNVTITPTKLRGAVTPPPSKSQAHRALIAAMLAEGECRVEHVAPSRDITATETCMAALLSGGEGLPGLDCGESGSTLRFLIPLALALRGGGRFTGHGRLMERPLKPYFDIFDEKGIFYEQKDGVLTVSGRLTPGEYRLPGNVSSQFITGLLYALPLLDGDSQIVLTTALESGDYVAMTLDVLSRFGVTIVPRKNGWLVPGTQKFRGCHMAVEADWSQAAFWYAAQALGNPVAVEGMNPRSIQGDREILDWTRMVKNEPLPGGVTVPIWGEGPAEAHPSSPSGGCAVSIDVSQNPDLVPPLAAMGALMNGVLRIKNAARLRIKESDRLSSVTAVLSALGAEVEEGPDFLTITGRPQLAGGVTVDPCNDHRIAMMAAIAATRCIHPVVINGAECVEKSYPDFWEDYERLGGTIRVW